MKKLIVASMLAPVMSLGLYAAPALADFDNLVIVKNYNDASVGNWVEVSASTGKNDANGGYGSDAGDGGDVNGSDDNNSGGSGGNGGNGGDGGVILTGNADATAKVVNKVNTNETDVDACLCEDDTLIKVKNHNNAELGNWVGVSAKTGKNDANGGDAGGSGGDGGDVNGSDDDNSGGAGGDAGNGGWGGLIGTGNATSYAKVVNRVNTNVTRIPPSL